VKNLQPVTTKTNTRRVKGEKWEKRGEKGQKAGQILTALEDAEASESGSEARDGAGQAAASEGREKAVAVRKSAAAKDTRRPVAETTSSHQPGRPGAKAAGKAAAKTSRQSHCYAGQQPGCGHGCGSGSCSGRARNRASSMARPTSSTSRSRPAHGVTFTVRTRLLLDLLLRQKASRRRLHQSYVCLSAGRHCPSARPNARKGKTAVHSERIHKYKPTFIMILILKIFWNPFKMGLRANCKFLII